MAPRETFEFIEERIISGRGVLQFPADILYRYFRVWVRVFRPPEVDYVNFKFNPEQGDYANIALMAQGHVWKTFKLEYDQQVFDLPTEEDSSFLAGFQVCTQDNILALLCAISTAVGAGGCIPGDTVYAQAVRFPFDEMLFTCRDFTAIQVTLYGLKFDVGCAAANPDPKLPAGAPSPVPALPPGTPTNTSAPYVPPDDNGNTIPAGGDTVDPGNEIGADCERYLVDVEFTPNSGSPFILQFGAFAPFRNDEVQIFANAGGAILTPPFPSQPSGWSYRLFCRGNYFFQACQPTQGYYSSGQTQATAIDSVSIVNWVLQP